MILILRHVYRYVLFSYTGCYVSYRPEGIGSPTSTPILVWEVHATATSVVTDESALALSPKDCTNKAFHSNTPNIQVQFRLSSFSHPKEHGQELYNKVYFLAIIIEKNSWKKSGEWTTGRMTR